MNKEVFKYLNTHFTQQPFAVDRLIVSSFASINDLNIEKNNLLNKYLIPETDVEEYEKLSEFLNVLDKFNIQFGFEELIELFEFVISPSDKIVTGAVYTPKKIRDWIVAQSLSRLDKVDANIKICDPACGCSGFLLTTAKEIKKYTGLSYKRIFQHNLFGLDIQEYSIVRSKLLMSLFAISEGEIEKEFKFNLLQGNALDFNWTLHIKGFGGFNLVVGNPPYVCSRNIDEESKKHLDKWSVCNSGHPDLYIPFFQLGMESLSDDGVLGYITMNTFFKSVNGRALRDYFNSEQYKLNIIDFGSEQVFQSKSTYTCICLIQKSKSDSINYVKIKNTLSLNGSKFNYDQVAYENLNAQTGWNLQSVDIVNKLESTGTPLGKLFKTRNGIATLKNGIYIFDPIDEDEDYYYLQNGKVYLIEKGICRDIVNPNKLTRIDEVNSLKRKVIFPYAFENEKAELLPNENFKSAYPKAYQYLKSKRNILDKRDKGKGDYEQWYAFGRNQSLEKLKYKLFFPHITPKVPNYILNSNETLLFYNGIAAIGKDESELRFLQKIMSSRLFWFYITNSSKPYGSGYFSLSRNYIKNFGIYDFSDKEYNYIVNENDSERLDKFLESKYEVKIQS